MSDQTTTPRPTPGTTPSLEPVEKIASATTTTNSSSTPHARTVAEIVNRIDDAWGQFYAAANSLPGEHMDEHLGEGWTRKQMLAHITAWHDLANERISHLLATGEPGVLTQATDTINARVARQAVGRTAGEVLKDMELSFKRLRRQVGRLTDDQLTMHDAWAAQMIGSNTYGHYEEHADDVYVASATSGRGARR